MSYTPKTDQRLDDALLFKDLEHRSLQDESIPVRSLEIKVRRRTRGYPPSRIASPQRSSLTRAKSDMPQPGAFLPVLPG